MIAKFNISKEIIKQDNGSIEITRSTNHDKTRNYVMISSGLYTIERNFPNSISGNNECKKFLEQFSTVNKIETRFKKVMKGKV